MSVIWELAGREKRSTNTYSCTKSLAYDTHSFTRLLARDTLTHLVYGMCNTFIHWMSGLHKHSSIKCLALPSALQPISQGRVHAKHLSQ